jgi:thioredoxin-like negative regulator of GroEL
MITLIKFSKPGCVPCTVLANALSEVDFADYNTELVEIDVAAQPEYIEKYNLSSVRVLLFEKEGQIVHSMIGLQPVYAVLEILNKHNSKLF